VLYQLHLELTHLGETEENIVAELK